jgi:Putative zinc-finger
MPNIQGPDTCPIDIDEMAEAYIMETLSPAGAWRFEDHYLTCNGCATAVEEAAEYVRAMKGAAEVEGGSPVIN